MLRGAAKKFKKTCCVTCFLFLLRHKKDRPLCRKPKTIFFTLEIVPIGNP
jgi:hypothetical protein